MAAQQLSKLGLKDGPSPGPPGQALLQQQAYRDCQPGQGQRHRFGPRAPWYHQGVESDYASAGPPAGHKEGLASRFTGY